MCGINGCLNTRPCPTHRTHNPTSKRRRTLNGSGWAWTATRQQVIRRDHGQCQHCTHPTPGVEVDHITPIEDGGTDRLDNLQLLCHACHKAKTREETRRRTARQGVGGFQSPRPPV